MIALKDKDHNGIIFNGIGILLRKPGGGDSVKVVVRVQPFNQLIIPFLFISSTTIHKQVNLKQMLKGSFTDYTARFLCIYF